MERSLPALRDLIDSSFSMDEVKSLCFNLGLDYENLAGETKRTRIESLLNDLDRRDRLPELFDLLKAERPNVPWEIGPETEQPNPYRGLAAFREEDASFFFGREEFSQQLLVAAEQHSLLAVIGPSGSGKSSVVYAGLLPKIRQWAKWNIASFRPGPRPFRSLAAALLPLLESGMSEVDQMVETGKLAEAFSSGDLDLESTVKRILEKQPTAKQLLLISDQFEEIYTLVPDEQRQVFLNLLLGYASSEKNDISLTLVITLRADFMGQVLGDSLLAERLQNRTLMLGPISRDGLKDVVEQPALRSGTTFESGLVERLLDDVSPESRDQSKAGNLPLLEFALTMLWERQEFGCLKHDVYESIGQINGALTRHADAVFESLDSAEHEQVRRLFMQLVKPGIDTGDSRRLATDLELGEAGWELAQRLAGPTARLVVVGTDESGRETAEIIHEALFQHWDRLQSWLKGDRAFRLWQERLRVLLRQWKDSGEDEGALLRGSLLDEAENWQKELPDNLSQMEREYVKASIDFREREYTENETRRQRELEQAKQLAEKERQHGIIVRRALVGLLLLLLVVVATAAYGFIQRDIARDKAQEAAAQATAASQAQRVAVTERVKAEEAENLANARWLVAVGQARFADDPMLGLALTLEGLALVRAEDNQIQESVLGDSRERIFEPGLLQTFGADYGVEKIWLSPDGRIFVIRYLSLTSIVEPEDFGHVGIEIIEPSSEGEIRQTSTGEILVSLEYGFVEDVDFSKDGRMFEVYISDNGTEWEYAYDNLQLDRLKDLDITNLSLDPDSVLFMGDVDGTRILGRTSDGEILFKFEDSTTQSISNSRDGSLFSVVYADGSIEVWETTSGLKLATLEGVDVSFSPDGSLFVVTNDDGTKKVLKGSDGQEFRALEEVTVTDISYGEDNRFFGITETDGEMRVVWTERDEVAASINSSDIRFVSSSPDGGLIVVATPTGNMQIWSTYEQQFLSMSCCSNIETVSFSPDGSLFVVGYESGESEIRFTVDGNKLDSVPDYIAIDDVFFSPQGRVFLLNYWTSPDGDLLKVGDVRQVSDGHVLDNLKYDYVKSVEFNTDDTFFVVNYETKSPEVRRVSDGHVFDMNGTLRNFEISENLLFVEYNDGTSELWNGQAGSFYRLRKLGNNVASVFFAPEPKRLLVLHQDGTANLLDLGWLETMGGQADSLPITTLSELACRYPMAHGALDEESLQGYLDKIGIKEPQACK